MTALITTLRLRAVVGPSCLDFIRRLFRNPRHRSKLPQTCGSSDVRLTPVIVCSSRKRRGMGARARTAGHDATVTSCIEAEK